MMETLLLSIYRDEVSKVRPLHLSQRWARILSGNNQCIIQASLDDSCWEYQCVCYYTWTSVIEGNESKQLGTTVSNAKLHSAISHLPIADQLFEKIWELMIKFATGVRRKIVKRTSAKYSSPECLDNNLARETLFWLV